MFTVRGRKKMQLGSGYDSHPNIEPLFGSNLAVKNV
jgi:hypothetical protein